MDRAKRHNSWSLNSLPTTSFADRGGLFHKARNSNIQSATFINRILPNEKEHLLARNTIPGVQFDSGERDPPPSCHPGTRLDISQKLVSWMRDLMRAHKVVWLHGPPGVGKSAVVQTLAESEAHSPTSILGATIFFSRPNERDDPQRLVITIAYQLAVKFQAYRAYVVALLMPDPLLVKKSLAEQFHLFIVKPFAEERLLEGIQETVLITLDGLDECNGGSAQRKIIFLITEFSASHPTTPFIWIITSRPEPQIRSAFSHPNVQGNFLEIEMPVDSDHAYADVERYLRDKFTEIQKNHPTCFASPAQRWPTETDFTKIARRSFGLFAFANTAVGYIGDASYAHPVAQLQKVLDALDSTPPPAAQDARLAALDVLYTLVWSEIPPEALPIARKLLMVRQRVNSFHFGCNLLAINQADAYDALQKLHSVLDIPPPKEAHHKNIRPFHASLDDYLHSQRRSGPFFIDPLGAEGVVLSASVRILSEAYNPVATVVRTSNVTVSWPDRGEDTKKELFQYAFDRVLRVPPEQTWPFEELRCVFQDIDYANFRTLISEPMIEMVSVFLKSRLLPHFKSWGIVTTALVQSLDLASISLDDEAYILSDKQLLLQIDGFRWKKSKSIIPIGSMEGLFPSDSQLSKIDDWYQKAVTLRKDTSWKAHILRHLTTIIGLLPTHPITKLGKGNKSCVLVAVDVLEQSWVYILPYREPQKRATFYHPTNTGPTQTAASSSVTVTVAATTSMTSPTPGRPTMTNATGAPTDDIAKPDLQYPTPSSALLDRCRSLMLKILKDPDQRARICSLSKDHAQAVVDYLDIVSREADILQDKERRRALSLLCELAKSAQLFPRCYTLTGIEYNQEAVAGGGFADVWKGKHGDQVLCLKVVRVYSGRENEDILRTHVQELALWAHLSHKNILPFYGAYLVDGATPRICLVSPWMERGDLRSYLTRFPQKLRMPFISDIVDGLLYLHGSGIVHSDLKAQNVLVSEDERALITDFGLSSVMATTAFTPRGGTFRFMAPELVLAEGKITESCDIWSFACLCYEILTNELPFYQYNDRQIIQALMRGEKPLRPEGGEGENGGGCRELNNEMWDLLVRCWSYEPCDRPSYDGIQKAIEGIRLQDDRPEVTTEVETPSAFWQAMREKSGNKVDYAHVEEVLLRVHF